MNNWFECKVAYERQAEGGLTKVSEAYLVDALSFTEAEARIIEEIQPMISMGELSVTNIRRMKLADLFLSEKDEDDRFYRIKVMMITYDEKADKEKKTAVAVLIQSDSLINAVKRLEEEYGELENYEVAAVTETALLDVFQEKLS